MRLREAALADIKARKQAGLPPVEKPVLRVIPVMDDVRTVTECAHNVADLRTVSDMVGEGRWLPSVEVGKVTYPLLGSGYARSVYDLRCGKHALKVYTQRERVNFVGEMRRECGFFETAPNDVLPFIVTILARFNDYSAAVVEKVDTRQPRVKDASARAQAAAWKARLLEAAAAHGIIDLKSNNFGWRDGQLVILDYGFSPIDQFEEIAAE